jgi:hypothetical protein
MRSALPFFGRPDVTHYVFAAYGAGDAWTTVIFLDIGATRTVNGAIQIGAVGAHKNALDALNAISYSDFIA